MQIKISTKHRAVLLALCFAFCICNINCTSSGINAKGVSQINLIVNYPVTVANDGKVKLYNLNDTISIFYYKSFVVYKLKPQRYMETNAKVEGTGKYFVFKKGKRHGFLFKDYKNIDIGDKLLVDSVLNQEAFGSLNFETNDTYQLHELVKQRNGKEVLEKYYFKLGYADMYDSVYHYYTNTFKTDNYSLSKKMDSVKQLKLFKVRLMYNEKFSQQDNVLLPKREYSFEIQQPSFANDTVVMRLFNKAANFN